MTYATGLLRKLGTRQGQTLLGSLVCITALTCLTGCPTTGTDGGNTPTSLSGAIVNLPGEITLSGSQTFTIIYNADPAATSVEAFYVEVESTAIDAPTIGAEVVFAMNLPTGDGQAVSLDTASIPTGLYRVGLNLSAGTLSAKVLSQGTFRITTLPQPVFTLPNQDLTTVPGSDPITIQATLGSPENAVNWRVFFVPAGTATAGVPAGQLGTTIDTGRANEAIVSWATAGVAVGDYQVGISVTDSGQTVAQTSADGNEDRIVTVLNPFIITLANEQPAPRPPLVQVSKPSGPETLFAGETTLVQFAVTVFEGPPDFQKVDVFYDFDREADSGDEVIFSGDLPVTATSAVFSIDMINQDETVNIGVTADDGKNDPVTVYAPGSVTFGTPQAASITCTQPSSLLSVKPDDEFITVNWQTVGISSAAGGNFDVFLRRTDATNMPTGPEIPVLTDAPLTQFSTTFTPTDVGKFEVTVRVTLDADPSNPLEDACPALVTVSSAPNVLWLGDLNVAANGDPPFDGAIFEGVNFEDNAGSAFAGAEDFDNDGLDEMFIVARYAKPFFVNASGIGIGEAYMIRGNSTRFKGRINLNSTASNVLPGFVFSGIKPVPPSDTDGMASIFVTRDADGDGKGEIAFGFPWAMSFFDVSRPLGAPTLSCPLSPVTDPQFSRGGVVIVSSLNTEVSTKSNDTSNLQCSLDDVGETFDVQIVALPELNGAEQVVSPEPTDGRLCQNATTWMDDQLEWFNDGDCPPDPGIALVGCQPSMAGDGEQETLIEPRWGFDFRLADPYPCLFGIPCFPGDPRGQLTEGCPSSDPNGTGCDTDQIDPAVPLCDAQIPLIGGMMADCDAEKDAAMLALPILEAFIEPLIDFATGTTFFRSGFYRERYTAGTPDTDNPGLFSEEPNWNDIVRAVFESRSLVGCRIIGRCAEEAYGTTITQSDNNLIVSAPLIKRPACPEETVSIAGRDGGGVAYTVERFNPEVGTSLRLIPRFWQLPEDLNFSATEYVGRITPPQPHQYLAGGFGSFGAANGGYSGSHEDGHGLVIFGDSDEQITNVAGIADFNEDGREDIAVGAPLGDVNNNSTPDGVLYIAFRRAESLEANFDLQKLKRDVSDVERLAGVMVREELDDEQRFGESIAGGFPSFDPATRSYTFNRDSVFDFNFDGDSFDVEDVVVGNPDGNNGTGEVVIVFGDNDLITQQSGVPVEDEGQTPGLLTRRQGARITGIELGSEFGFNVANIGDIDGDGKDDLAIAAPNATPFFDSDITDDNDSLDPAVNAFALPGVDLNLDGVADDVTGPNGIPDGTVDANDELRHAGLVYIILGSNDARRFAPDSQSPMDISIGELGTVDLDGFIIVGHRGDRFAPGDTTGGTIIHAGDFLGGGFAGSTSRTIASSGVTVEYGGNTSKAPLNGRERGRSFGMGRAGDIDGDGRGDFLLGAQMADPRVDPVTGEGTTNGGEAYLIYGFAP